MDFRQKYQAWLGDPKLDAETRRELEAIAEDDKEIEDRFYQDLAFGTAGMRGVIGAGTNRMNRYMVRKATAGLARFLCGQGEAAKNAGVAIAYDSRLLSDVFAQDTARVLCAYGIRVFLYSVLHPVPMLSYAVRELHCTAGVVITASHNPKQYNGYKVYGPSGGQMEPDDADVVTAAIAQVTDLTGIPMMELDKAEESGLLVYLGQAMDDSYTQKVLELPIRKEIFSRVDKDFRLIYTPLHGTGSVPVQRVLREAGIPGVIVVKEQEKPDPMFFTVRTPNPEEKDALNLAIALAQEAGADLCIGTDPDCDRMGLAVRDRNGQFVLLTGNQIGCILLDYILNARQEKGILPANAAAVKSIVSTNMADAIAASYGVDMISVLTGFKFIAGKIEEFEAEGNHTYVFGFEESFGYMAGPFVRDKDAVQASLLAAEAAVWYRLQGKTLLDALQAIYEKHGYYAEGVLNVAFPGREGGEKMQNTMASLRSNPPHELAGVKVVSVSDHLLHKTTLLDTGATETYAMDMPASNVLIFHLEGGNRFIIRPSGTEPKIKLYFNVKDIAMDKAQAKLNAISEDAKERYFK